MSVVGWAICKSEAMTFTVTVDVQLRAGVADPQGSTIERSLPTLGFDGVSGMRVGKSKKFAIEAADEAAARSTVEQMCERFLTNPVIEDSTIVIESA